MNSDPHQLPPSPFSYRNIAESFPNLGERLGDFFTAFFFWLQVVSLFVSIFLILGIVYSTIRINHIRKKEKEALKEAEVPVSVAETEPVTIVNPRWEHVLSLVQSESEQDWRVAIMEADIMLNDMMTRMQYEGETLGIKLKSVEKSDFNTIDNAWDAHKVRNEIAHKGNEYILSKREVDRTIRLYQSVFEEFHFI
ncbi:MAG: hypothetical protein WDZ74_00055 [Candidatus Paceibacterota bacterium]